MPISPTVCHKHFHLNMPPTFHRYKKNGSLSPDPTESEFSQRNRTTISVCKGYRLGMRLSTIMGAGREVSATLLFLCLVLSLKSVLGVLQVGNWKRKLGVVKDKDSHEDELEST